MNKTLADMLTEARNSLTPVTWKKGSYFKKVNDTLCMCAHGAVQAVVNPVCKNSLTSNQAIGHAIPVAWSNDGLRNVEAHRFLSKQDIWNNRSLLVTKKIPEGNGEAHYLLGMVGLTINFNDAKDTTFEMVKAKFDEAIALANQLGV